MAWAGTLRRLGRDYSRDLLPAEWASGVSLHGSNPELLMSALGHKRTFSNIPRMSALPPKADIARPEDCLQCYGFKIRLEGLYRDVDCRICVWTPQFITSEYYGV